MTRFMGSLCRPQNVLFNSDQKWMHNREDVRLSIHAIVYAFQIQTNSTSFERLFFPFEHERRQRMKPKREISRPEQERIRAK